MERLEQGVRRPQVKHTTGNNKVSTFRRPAASGRGYAAIATQSPT